MKEIEIIEEMEKLFPSEFLNLYFVYKEIKKGFFSGTNKNGLNDVIKLCKKLKLNYLLIKYSKEDYFIFISKKNIKEPDFYIKNDKKNHKNIGSFLGFPKKCINNFHSNKNKYLHIISVDLNLKNRTIDSQVFNFVCDSRMISYLKNKKNKIRKVLEKISGLIDFEISAEIREYF